MDVQSISPVKTLVSSGPTRVAALQLDEKPRPYVEKQGSSTEYPRANGARQRVQPLQPAPSTIEPIDFHDGVIGTFINEMDLLQTRVLASGDEDSPQSIDALA